MTEKITFDEYKIAIAEGYGVSGVLEAGETAERRADGWWTIDGELATPRICEHLSALSEFIERTSGTYECTPLYRADAVLCASGFAEDGRRMTLGYGPSRRAAKRKVLARLGDAWGFFPSRFSRCFGEIELDLADVLDAGEGRVHPWLTERVERYGAELPTVADVGVW